MAPTSQKPLDLPGLVAKYPLPTLALAAVGGWSIFKVVFSLTRVLLQLFVLPGKSLKTYGAKKGAWAVVTGATDGIGREFANQLAKAGFNVVLASRSPEKLGVAAAQIEEKYKVSTKTYAMDFAHPDEKSWAGLASTISGLDIGVLVNNVGKSHDIPVTFAETDVEEINDILTININSTLRVTQTVLPSLLARKKGLILNIGSFAAQPPSAMLATYSGSKGFLTTWSQALGEELKEKGILVQLVNTFFVVSAMSKIRKPNALTPLPVTYVRSVLSHIGSPCGALGKPYQTTPFWSHALVDWVMGQLGFVAFFIKYSHGLQKDTRRRALKKREREAKKQ